MEPAFKLNIPIELRNTFKPDRAGTLICSSAKSEELNGPTDSLIKGVSNIDDIALINVEGPGKLD
jgi:aspartokinase/homoserine dehydrogenase 1